MQPVLGRVRILQWGAIIHDACGSKRHSCCLLGDSAAVVTTAAEASCFAVQWCDLLAFPFKVQILAVTASSGCRPPWLPTLGEQQQAADSAPRLSCPLAGCNPPHARQLCPSTVDNLLLQVLHRCIGVQCVQLVQLHPASRTATAATIATATLSATAAATTACRRDVCQPSSPHTPAICRVLNRCEEHLPAERTTALRRIWTRVCTCVRLSSCSACRRLGRAAFGQGILVPAATSREHRGPSATVLDLCQLQAALADTRYPPPCPLAAGVPRNVSAGRHLRVLCRVWPPHARLPVRTLLLHAMLSGPYQTRAGAASGVPSLLASASPSAQGAQGTGAGSAPRRLHTCCCCMAGSGCLAPERLIPFYGEASNMPCLARIALPACRHAHTSCPRPAMLVQHPWCEGRCLACRHALQAVCGRYNGRRVAAGQLLHDQRRHGADCAGLSVCQRRGLDVLRRK